MKNVGIITMHRVCNCGSLLQAYALQKVIENFGYECEIIDYIYPNKEHKKILKKKSFNSFLRKIVLLPFILQRNYKMNIFLKKYLKTSPKKYISSSEIKSNCPKYDFYVTGSDQVWNPRFNCEDSTFFLSFVDFNSKCISYASSMALTKTTEEYNSFLRLNLSKYQYIGVRESSSQLYLKRILNKPIYKNCDPTLLLRESDINYLVSKSTLKINKKYILFYLLTYSYDPFPEIDTLIKKLIDEKKVVPVFFFCSRKSAFKYKGIYINKADPCDFISLIKNAELVVTSSFHGTCFSILQHKDFFSLCKTNQDQSDERIQSLLNELGLKNRILYKENGFNLSDAKKIDYIDVDYKLEEIRKSSLGYLQTALK